MKNKNVSFEQNVTVMLRNCYDVVQSHNAGCHTDQTRTVAVACVAASPVCPSHVVGPTPAGTVECRTGWNTDIAEGIRRLVHKIAIFIKWPCGN